MPKPKLNDVIDTLMKSLEALKESEDTNRTDELIERISTFLNSTLDYEVDNAEHILESVRETNGLAFSTVDAEVSLRMLLYVRSLFATEFQDVLREVHLEETPYKQVVPVSDLPSLFRLYSSQDHLDDDVYDVFREHVPQFVKWLDTFIKDSPEGK